MKNFTCSLVLSVLLLVPFGAAYAQATNSNVVNFKPAAKPVVSKDYPFVIDGDSLTAKVNLNDAKIERYYTSLFQKYLYSGNSRTWEDMIEELMEEKDADFAVRNKLDFNSDETYFSVTASSREELDKFISIVQPTFAVLSRLEGFIKTINPAHIIDGSHKPEGY